MCEMRVQMIHFSELRPPKHTRFGLEEEEEGSSGQRCPGDGMEDPRRRPRPTLALVCGLQRGCGDDTRNHERSD